MTHRSTYQDDGFAYLAHSGIVRETDKARLYRIQGEEIWIPVSQIEDDNGEILAIPKWLAEAKELESDY